MGEVETGNILCAYNLNLLFLKYLLQRVCSIYYLTHSINLKIQDLLTLTTLPNSSEFTVAFRCQIKGSLPCF